MPVNGVLRTTQNFHFTSHIDPLSAETFLSYMALLGGNEAKSHGIVPR